MVGEAISPPASCGNSASLVSDEAEDILNRLPLPLLRSQLIPPAPNRRRSAIDFLYDFGGASWVAYGASSLLVISHFPSPVPEHENLVGPFFRQVIEPPSCLDAGGIDDVNAVSWCPALPSGGVVAAAQGNYIWLYMPHPDVDTGSLSWRQIAGIMHPSVVDAIEWTGSGDGLVAAGIDVSFWRRKGNSWEMAWKSAADVPQVCVSAAWSAEGPVATTAGCLLTPGEMGAQKFSNLDNMDCRHVSVYHSDGKSQVTKTELRHSQPVSLIRWRPASFIKVTKDALRLWRDLLLTCCLDGTVRLWSEIDNGKHRKVSKDTDHRVRQPFQVVAVIEIEQCLNGTLGLDIFIDWVVDLPCAISKSKRGSLSLSPGSSKHDQIASCEWLISVGPVNTVTLWAVHCLDDAATFRSPRVTLWRKQNPADLKACSFSNYQSMHSAKKPMLLKVVAMRRQLFGPPLACSLIQLLPDNSISWWHFYSQSIDEHGSLAQVSKEKCLSYFKDSVLNLDGHSANIVQLTLLPYSHKPELAVSLDSNGFLFFWSISKHFNFPLEMQMHIYPTWKLLRKVKSQDLSTDLKYLTMACAHFDLDEKPLLFLGYDDGIDCFLIEVSGEGESISCHKIFSVSFSGHRHIEGSPDQIISTPIASLSRCFLLYGVWVKEFRTISWKIILQPEVLIGSARKLTLNFETASRLENIHRSVSYGGNTYAVTICASSWNLPFSQNSKTAFCISMVSPDHFMASNRSNVVSDNGSHRNSFSLLATGYSDGILELWKVFSEKPLESECLPWVLVGKIAAHDGPVNAVSVSNCGGKIATVSISDINSLTVLHIWTPLCLMGSGTFILEDVLLFNKPVVALKWAILGNGKLLLGVCMSNEFHIYCERRFHDLLLESDNYKESHAWCCISLSHFFHHCHDFQWGPMLTPVFLHERKISVFCEWLSETESKHIGEISSIYTATTEKCCGITIKNNVHGANEVNQSDKKNGIVLSVLSSSSFMQECSSKNRNRFHCLMDMVERLCRPLESHHPWELLQYLYRGNWKHVYFVMKYLVDSLTHVDASTAQLEHHSSRKLFYIPHVSKYFDGMTPTEKANNTFQWGKGISSGSTIFKENISQFEYTLNPRICKDFSLTNSLKSEIMEFIDFLEKSNKLTGLANLEKIHMLTVLDFLLELSNTSQTSLYESLDEPGQRFWVSVRFQHLLFRRKVGSVASVEDFAVDSWLVAWAFHSDCQESLLNSLLSTESSWPEMRNLGMGYWFTNLSNLRTRMEKLARLQYLKRKNPRDCALLYLALKKVQVLAGLFKISKDENDKILFGFLSRNFQEEKNKAAALKNAYVLMGRHQLELAVSFFLLGGDPSSAVSVCAKNLGDEQLALIICRLLDGYGGPLEKQLISTILLPNAIENKDYWLSSILDWSLGNYFESVTRLFKSLLHCTNHVASRNCSYISVADPHIGRYCVVLASKHCLKNTIGANVASVLSKFATMLDSYSLNRYGLPMEALECFVSYTMDGNSQNNTQDIDAIFQELLDPFYTANGTQTWLQEDIAHHFESHFKLSLAMQYISCFVSELPWWAYRRIPVTLTELIKLDDSDCDLYKHKALEYSREKLNVVILAFERRYSLKLVDLANMVLLFACNNGLLFLGYQLLHRLIFWGHEADDHPKAGHCSLCSIAPGFIVNVNKELFYAYSRYVVCCHFSDSALKQLCGRGSTAENCSTIIIQRNFCLQYLICSLRIVKPLLNCCDHLLSSASFFELIGYMMFFSCNWFNRNLSGLIQLLFQIHRVFVSNQDSIDVMPGELMKLLNHTSVCSTSDVSTDNADVLQDFINKKKQVKRSNSSEFSIPENEIWLFMGTSFWMQNTKLTNQQYSKLLTTHKLEAERSMTDNNQFFLTVAKLAMVSVAYVSSSLTKQLASFLREKASKGSPVAAFSLFEESNQLELCSLIYDFDPESWKLSANGDKKALGEMLWKCVNAKEIYQNLSNEKVYGFTYNSEELFSSWIDFKKFNFFEHENDDNSQYTSGDNFSSGTSNALGSARNYLDVSTFLGTSRNSNSKLETANFCNPIEIAKKSGELLEAICINSINEHQLAATSNRKGLFFFNWKMEPALKEKALHIWLEADWPFDGWTDADFAHSPTCVSPGAGIGNKSGVHVGLGEATVGLGSMARPVKELTGGAAFGIPGYAGIGASGLDWGGEIQFDEFLDGSATVQNMNSRALCSHPSRPFLLVGSVNTLVYLWKFGNDKATATYGFLPAINARSHQAHATISDLEFDRCGHRFATAALDGTVCTWQLEVEGKTNARPMESSLCFNNQASDVAFLAASGSILAAAGCSTDGHNVVLWDTLAPPGTSQASLICHEGGARSLSVFDNDVGSGSISPLIVTGGKGGDVGLHDFRFIATGKSNRHRQLQDQNFKSSSFISTFKHIDNTNGMIWYIPKAHSGSIMKIATIPDTSMFLTGGKDGDVKLWDAKRERLVFHWQRIHDRHTFIQPNTKGIGGIVRAAVTDIRVFSSGFITCGGDGSVKLVQLK